MLAFIFDQMNKLDKGVINVETASAQAKLAKQANNVLDYELKRTLVQIKLQKIGALTDIQEVKLRDVESKPLNEDNFQD
jgi:hypothetical protein